MKIALVLGVILLLAGWGIFRLGNDPLVDLMRDYGHTPPATQGETVGLIMGAAGVVCIVAVALWWAFV